MQAPNRFRTVTTQYDAVRDQLVWQNAAASRQGDGQRVGIDPLPLRLRSFSRGEHDPVPREGLPHHPGSKCFRPLSGFGVF